MNKSKSKITDVDGDNKVINKSDVALLVIVLGIAVLALVSVMLTRKPGAKLQISLDGEVVETFSLSEDREHQVVTDKGTNLVVIKDGVVDVAEADCPDKVCVNHVSIESVGETIICLPHKLVFEVVE